MRTEGDCMKRLAALLAASLLLAGCTAAGSGGMRASRPTAAPVWPETQNLFVGADSISARGLAATQGSRDDLRPKSRACGPVGLRNAPAGAVRASSPTGVCCNAGPQLPGWPRHSPSSVGADSISARGCLRRRRVRRDEGIPPYGRPEGGRRPCFARNEKFIRRGGIYPARGRLRRRGAPGTMRASSPTGGCVMRGRSFPVGRGIRRHP